MASSRLSSEAAAVDVMVDALADLVGIALRSVNAGGVGVTVAQHRVLVLLEQHGAVSVSVLARHLGVDQSNASRHSSRLVRLGLADRSRGRHDGRAVELRLTARGRLHIEKVRDARRRELSRVLDRLPEPSVEAVASAFKMFHDGAQDMDPE